jgi:hypothetical protein
MEIFPLRFTIKRDNPTTAGGIPIFLAVPNLWAGFLV